MNRYDRLVLADGPVGYWPLDDPAGSKYAADISGWNLHAVYTGGAAPQGRSVGTWLCPDFDGTNDYVLVPAFPAGNPLQSAMSLEAWVVADAVGNGTGIASDPYTGGGDFINLEIGLDPLNGTASHWGVLAYPGSGGDTVITPSEGPTAGILYHVVGVHEGSRIRLYVRGADRGDHSATFSVDNDGLYIARRHDVASAAPYWNGVVTRVARYDRALDKGTVLSHWLAGTAAP